MKLINFFFFFALASIISTQSAEACTRVVYKGPESTVLTARSMDWKHEIDANIWVYPKGIQRTGEVGPQSVKWTSKYGSITASAWDIATVDGMNEAGLVANVLWLAESQYPKFDPNGTVKGLSISLWAQYILDNFATVAEAVDYLKNDPFVIVSDNIPGSTRFANLHLSISDKAGDNAIFEYAEGKLIIHHSPSYVVMTNSPLFDKQLTLDEYWQGIPGTIFLPGTNRAADRFVRASYYVHAIPQTSDRRIATASIFSVIRNCSVPFGISSEEEPNISSTRWRSVSDQKNLIYYFETVLTPNVFWSDLSKFDLSEKGKTLKLSLDNYATYNGDAYKSFKPTPGFKFLGI